MYVVIVDYRENRDKRDTFSPPTKQSTAQQVERNLTLALRSVDAAPNTTVYEARLESADVIIGKVVDVATDETKELDEHVSLSGTTDLLSAVVGKPVRAHFCIENKWMEDLAQSRFGSSSGKVNHWDDEIKRQTALCDKLGAVPVLCHKGYFQHCLNGNPVGLGPNRVIPENAIHKTMVDVQLLDGFRVFPCVNNFDVARTVYTIVTRMQKRHMEPDGWIRYGTAETSIDLQARKKDNFTVREWTLYALMGIPRMSQARAEAVTAVYPSLKELLEEYSRCDDHEAEVLLADIQVPGQKDGAAARRLGDKLSSDVYRTLGKNGPPLQK